MTPWCFVNATLIWYSMKTKWNQQDLKHQKMLVLTNLYENEPVVGNQYVKVMILTCNHQVAWTKLLLEQKGHHTRYEGLLMMMRMMMMMTHALRRMSRACPRDRSDSQDWQTNSHHAQSDSQETHRKTAGTVSCHLYERIWPLFFAPFPHATIW